MAHFISEQTSRVEIRPDRTIYDPETGKRVGAERRLFVALRQWEAPSWAKEKAREAFAFKMYPVGVDPLNLFYYVNTDVESVHHGWTDAEHDEVVERMRSIQDVLEVKQPMPEAPWATYDNLSPEQNLELASATGRPIEDLIVYEEATQNRMRFLDEYRSALEPEEIGFAVEA
jgi:hypothetical protein